MKVKKYIVRIFLWLPCAVFGSVRNNLNGEKGDSGGTLRVFIFRKCDYSSFFSSFAF